MLGVHGIEDAPQEVRLGTANGGGIIAVALVEEVAALVQLVHLAGRSASGGCDRGEDAEEQTKTYQVLTLALIVVVLLYACFLLSVLLGTVRWTEPHLEGHMLEGGKADRFSTPSQGRATRSLSDHRWYAVRNGSPCLQGSLALLHLAG